jgi:hypothetical protein
VTTVTTIEEIRARLAAGGAMSLDEMEAIATDRRLVTIQGAALCDLIQRARRGDQAVAEVERLRAVLPTVEEARAMKRGLGGRLAEDAFARLDAYRAHEAASERFRARAGDEPGGAMVSDGTKEGGEHG